LKLPQSFVDKVMY